MSDLSVSDLIEKAGGPMSTTVVPYFLGVVEPVNQFA